MVCLNPVLCSTSLNRCVNLCISILWAIGAEGSLLKRSLIDDSCKKSSISFVESLFISLLFILKGVLSWLWLTLSWVELYVCSKSCALRSAN